MAPRTIRAALAAGILGLLATAPALAQEEPDILVRASAEAATVKLGVATPLPVDCGASGCTPSDLDYVFLTGAADQEGIFYRARAEGYFENPPTPTDGVLQMKGQLRQEVGATRESRFVTQLELTQTVTWSWETRGSLAFWEYTYRFDGTSFNGLAPGMTGSLVAEALGTSYFNLTPGPLTACRPTSTPGECTMPFIPGELGALPVDQTLVLRLTATINALGGSTERSLQWADYTHTLALLQATPYGLDGKPLAGPWSLYANGELAFASAPVPEPPAALLALLGLGAMAWRRRCRA